MNRIEFNFMPNIISINTVQINRKCGNNILKKILKLTEVQVSIRFFPIEFYLTSSTSQY